MWHTQVNGRFARDDVLHKLRCSAGTVTLLRCVSRVLDHLCQNLAPCGVAWAARSRRQRRACELCLLRSGSQLAAPSHVFLRMPRDQTTARVLYSSSAQHGSPSCVKDRFQRWPWWRFSACWRGGFRNSGVSRSPSRSQLSGRVHSMLYRCVLPH